MVRKLDLEKALLEIAPHPTPKAYLEQYTIPPEVAAEILYTATYIYDDVIDKTIIDLGCGTGRLAIGAALLGAKEATGIDSDRVAAKIALINAEKMGVKEKTSWVVADIDAVCGSFDTVLQNPPFGIQKRKADRKFIKKSLQLGHRIYSLHKSGKQNRGFIKRFIEKRGGRVTGIFPMQTTIPKLFEFHTRRKHNVGVDLYQVEGKTCG
ncbi:MAG: 50S ribosomal protein L11 methyltransferase [Candidatus Bathyarchaeota archaeon]|nr:MAG: 50S ribosomal protein L11 methyltransferase [Candidatus Bathyarchaeota archaeon]